MALAVAIEGSKVKCHNQIFKPWASNLVDVRGRSHGK
jgi:hypothetical protein